MLTRHRLDATGPGGRGCEGRHASPRQEGEGIMSAMAGHQGRAQGKGAIEVTSATGFRPEPLAEILTEVDPFIYPALFDGAPSKASLLAKLAHLDESPLAEEHWLVASMESGDGERIPVGICVRQRRRLRPADEGWREMGLSRASEDACERYLGHIFEDTGDDRAYVMAIATLPAFRRRGSRIGSAWRGD